MTYAVETGSGAMMYIPSVIKIGSGIQKLIGGYTYRQRHIQQGYLINLHLFFQTKWTNKDTDKVVPVLN
jgi:hypothetical protein